MGAFEDYINKVEKESGRWQAYWQLCTLEMDYRRKYGRNPSKSELLGYGNSLIGGNSCTRSKASTSISPNNSSIGKDNTSQPCEDKEKSSNDSVPEVSFNKAYKIWK